MKKMLLAAGLFLVLATSACAGDSVWDGITLSASNHMYGDVLSTEDLQNKVILLYYGGHN